MRRYRTEILIPPDRLVGLQLPAHLPEGRAIVTILIEEPEAGDDPDAFDFDPDRQDIEWWEEFDGPDPDEPSGRFASSTAVEAQGGEGFDLGDDRRLGR